MHKLFFAFCFLLSIFCQAQRIKLEIEFRYGKPDCSGRCKTDEQIQNSKIDKPLANQRFYIYQSGVCVDSIKTNDSGLVVIKYPPGRYYLYEPWKHFKKTPDGSPMSDFFPDCIVKEWVKPNYYLTIEMDGEYKMTYLEISASRCSFQYPCLKVRHLPSLIKTK
ncbi:prealbumin-like fold domain-containing protein [Sediminibacterium sp.]|uniref:prealbumin-like fold domain-containing protein n=1 Tax=Sediminibacterium sp. TaxID=1917865 RepID=UPI0027366DAE|nr:prealbumin-like fold domain-containing protein [Sediminibacterium sp.]MDP3567318.1 prealbumin-like fold domain-containing protein [Sediminibacterium sp.]